MIDDERPGIRIGCVVLIIIAALLFFLPSKIPWETRRLILIAVAIAIAILSILSLNIRAGIGCIVVVAIITPLFFLSSEIFQEIRWLIVITVAILYCLYVIWDELGSDGRDVAQLLFVFTVIVSGVICVYFIQTEIFWEVVSFIASALVTIISGLMVTIIFFSFRSYGESLLPFPIGLKILKR